MKLKMSFDNLPPTRNVKLKLILLLLEFNFLSIAFLAQVYLFNPYLACRGLIFKKNNKIIPIRLLKLTRYIFLQWEHSEVCSEKSTLILAEFKFIID